MIVEIYPKNIIIRGTYINYRVIQLAKEQDLLVTQTGTQTAVTYIFQGDYEQLYKFLYNLSNEVGDCLSIKII